MSDMKMSDVFNLPVSFELDALNEKAPICAFDGNRAIFQGWTEPAIEYAARAINTHDQHLARIAELEGAIEAAMRIKDLWCPNAPFADNPPEHYAELEALHIMKDSFNKLLEQSR